MKRINWLKMVVTSMAILFVIGNAMAETVSQKAASNIARQFFNEANKRITSEPKMVFNGRKLTTHRLFNPFYVYNSPSGGFVIISAENKAYPILAFSREGSFDPNFISEKMKALLSLYANHIEAIRYDDRAPVNAIAAWGDINRHIADILSQPYNATDSRISDQELSDMLDNALKADKVEEYVSFYYTPDEWVSTVAKNISATSTLPLGLISPTEVIPVELVGSQGDFFRILLDSPDRGLWRLLPTEFLSQGEMAMFNAPMKIKEEEIPDDTFKFFEEFKAEVEAAVVEEIRAKEIAVNHLQPVIQDNGGGHFIITLPQNVSKANIYNVAGAKISSLSYKDTPVAYIDISTEPAGFYIVILEGVDGTPYSFKLYR